MLTSELSRGVEIYFNKQLTQGQIFVAVFSILFDYHKQNGVAKVP